MKTQIIKPVQLNISQKMLNHAGKNYCHISADMFLLNDDIIPMDFYSRIEFEPLVNNRFHENQSLPPSIGGFAKPYGEWIVAGDCIVKESEETGVGRVKVEYGEKSKELIIYGHREWTPSISGGYSITRPEPFDSMPLTLNNAFGGEKYFENLIGKGHEDFILPNIEDSKNLIVEKTDKVFPASFLPISTFCEQKQKYTGTQDADWALYFEPDLPEDYDWTYHQETSTDQWIEGYFDQYSSQEFILHHMNSEQPKLTVQPQNYAVRCVVKFKNGEFKEVPINFDTVILYPTEECYIMGFHGSFETEDFRGLDIEAILCGYEEKTQEGSRSFEYYKNALEWRLVEDIDPAYLDGVTGDLSPVGHCSGQQILHSRAKEYSDNQKNDTMTPLANKVLDKALGRFQEKKDILMKKGDKNDFSVNKAKSSVEGQVQPFVAKLQKAKETVNSGKTSQSPGNYLDLNDPLQKELFDKVEAIIPFFLIDMDLVDPDNLIMSKLDKVMACFDEFHDKLAKKMTGKIDNELIEANKGTKNIIEDMEDGETKAELKKQMLGKKPLSRELFSDFDPETETIPRAPKAMHEQFGGQKIENNFAQEKTNELFEVLKGGRDEPNVHLEGNSEKVALVKALEPEIKANTTDDVINEKLDVLKDAFFNSRKMAAHSDGKKLSPHPTEHEKLQEQMLESIKSNNGVFNLDLACIIIKEQIFKNTIFNKNLMEQIEFHNCQFDDVDMTNNVITNATFKDCILNNVNISDTNIGKTYFENCQINKLTLDDKTKLEAINILNSTINEIDFSNKQLVDIILKNNTFSSVIFKSTMIINGQLVGNNFENSKLFLTLFSDTELVNNNFSKCQFERSSVTDGKMSDNNLENNSLMQTSFIELKEFNNNNFANSKLQFTIFRVKGKSNSFKYCELSYCFFDDSELTHSDFSYSKYENASMSWADLRESKFVKAELKDAKFFGANLKDSDFSDGFLYRANFKKGIYGGTKFNNSFLEDTIFKDWRPNQK